MIYIPDIGGSWFELITDVHLKKKWAIIRYFQEGISPATKSLNVSIRLYTKKPSNIIRKIYKNLIKLYKLSQRSLY